MIARVVTLRNRRGQALHCVLHEPVGKAERGRVAAVLLCPGIKTRVGPHRLYRKLVPPFMARGIPVLRVDFHGLGDSEGEWPDESLEQIYRMTELGHCVDDARSALDWLESRLGIRECIVGGLCGGAITALHLASLDRRLAALYAIGLPARLDGTVQPRSVAKDELHSHRSTFLRKLRRPASWLRFLSLRSDYRLMWRAFARAPSKPGELAPDLNPHLLSGFLGLLKAGRPALLMFGEHDPSRWYFDEKFLQPCSAALEPYRELITYSVIPRANHVLGDPDAVLAATRLTDSWLDAHFGAKAASAGAPGLPAIWRRELERHVRSHAA